MSEPRTLGQMLLQRVQKTPDGKAIGWFEAHEVKSMNFREYGQTIEQLTLALIKHGMAVGDRVAILAATAKEWHLMDMATMCGRGVVIPIYPSYLGHEVKWLLEHSEASILVVDNDAQMEKIAANLSELKNLKLIVALTQLSEETHRKFRNLIPCLTYKELLREGTDEMKLNPGLFSETIKAQLGEDMASIIYTSGTTGEPKGAVITQHGFTTMLNNIRLFIKGALGPADRTLTFLPLLARLWPLRLALPPGVRVGSRLRGKY